MESPAMHFKMRAMDLGAGLTEVDLLWEYYQARYPDVVVAARHGDQDAAAQINYAARDRQGHAEYLKRIGKYEEFFGQGLR